MLHIRKKRVIVFCTNWQFRTLTPNIKKVTFWNHCFSVR